MSNGGYPPGTMINVKAPAAAHGALKILAARWSARDLAAGKPHWAISDVVTELTARALLPEVQAKRSPVEAEQFSGRRTPEQAQAVVQAWLSDQGAADN